MKSVTLRSGSAPAPAGPGRPAGWESPAAKQRAYRARCQEQRQCVADLLQAVRNAHWDDAEFARLMRDGTETEVLTALTTHYRAQHWSLRNPAYPVPAAAETAAKGAIKAKV